MLNGQPLSHDNPFTTQDGTQYPANWLRLSSADEKASIGITEVSDPEPYDDRFYWGVGNPKDLAILKSNWKTTIKDTAGKLLAQTDWMLIRKIERSVDVPTDVATYRAAVIAEASRLETDIDGSVDVPALITVVATQAWPEID